MNVLSNHHEANGGDMKKDGVNSKKDRSLYVSDIFLAERYAVARPTIWRWARSDKTFPKPVKLSPGCSRWNLPDLEKWEEQRAKNV